MPAATTGFVTISAEENNRLRLAIAKPPFIMHGTPRPA